MATVAKHSVTIASIYQEEGEYNYSVPKEVLITWSKGEGFPGATLYTPEERAAIDQDLQTILNKIMSQSPTAEKKAIYTAGPPGAGKSTLLDKELTVLNGSDTRYAFNDPDEQCLKNMQSTYWKTIKTAKEALKVEEKLNKETEKKLMQEAYTKWRPASNYITHMIQGYLISKGINFAFGTTATSDKTHFGLRHLQKQGYEITCLHLTTEDDVRIQSVMQHSLFHTTEEDIREKANMFPPRLDDTYLPHSNIKFYYRGHPGDAVHAATFTKESGLLEIFSQPAYQAIATWHNAHKTAEAPSWKDTMAAFVKETRIIGS